MRLIVPHAGLLLITVLYAFAGAVVFYLVEHPNEILVRQYALDEIRTARKTIEEQLQLSTKLRLPEHLWKEELSTKIHKLTEVLHASSKNYVNPQNLRQSFIEPDKKPEKIWTISSALSFAFTTMATIGK